jgi:uncharacterized membrane protein (UPF0127 family)
MKKFLIIIVIAVIVIGGFFYFSKEPKEPTLTIGDKSIYLIIADSDEERELGLGNRESLPENEAMLFVFEKPDKYAFWMKDMKFPIDIIWLDQEFKIVHIAYDVQVESYPEFIFEPPQESLYVLETVAGFAQKNGLKVGDRLEVSLNK